jgi:poly-gamma-glutamate synthesis protein (capsule biosynthesis protein)
LAVRTPRLAFLLLAAAFAAASCSDPPDWQQPAAAPASASPTPAVAEEITLAFAGDLHFHDRTRRLLNNPETAVGPFSEQLRAADFAMVNLETAITTRGTEEPKRYHFRAPTTAYAAIQAAGIDLVSVANNHALDYGQVGLLDTSDSAAAANMPIVGAGRTSAEAYAPYLTTIKGVRLAVIGLSQVWELSTTWKATETRPGLAMAFDTTRSADAVRAARTIADIVIVYLHWGNESQTCPSADQKKIAKILADAGADIVLGTHAHVLLADGFIGNTYIHYGLGNFVWHSDFRGTDTGLLELTVRPRNTGSKVASHKFTPGVTSSATGGVPRPAAGAALEAIEGRLDAAHKCSGLAPTPAS